MKTTTEILEALQQQIGKKLGGIARSIDRKPQVLYDLRDGKVKGFSFELATDIKNKYPGINREFLMTGKGNIDDHEQNIDFRPGLNLPELKKALIEAKRQITIVEQALGINSDELDPASGSVHVIEKEPASVKKAGLLGKNEPRSSQEKSAKQKGKSLNKSS